MSDRATGSLVSGRSTAPLTPERIRSVSSTFLSLDRNAVSRHDPTGHTRFVVEIEDGEEIGVVYFGSDIYPGSAVYDPNSALSMKAAAAHELSHLNRWMDDTELPLGVHTHLDEALTSLDAVLRFGRAHLSDHEVEQLVRDAVQRLQLHRHLLANEGELGDADPRL